MRQTERRSKRQDTLKEDEMWITPITVDFMLEVAKRAAEIKAREEPVAVFQRGDSQLEGEG